MASASEFLITPELRKSCGLANRRYKAHLEELKKENALSEREKKKKDSKDDIKRKEEKMAKLERMIRSYLTVSVVSVSYVRNQKLFI